MEYYDPNIPLACGPYVVTPLTRSPILEWYKVNLPITNTKPKTKTMYHKLTFGGFQTYVLLVLHYPLVSGM